MAVVALGCCLAALAGVLLGQLRGDFQSIGQQDAPEAGATTGLYFALNDMDAQVANVLLVGGDTALRPSRAQDLATYAQRPHGRRPRPSAGDGLRGRQRRRGATQLSLVLDRIGQYEALAADALLTSQQSHSAAGRAPAAAVAYYQQATGLMQDSILPAVGSLTTVSAARLDAAYHAGKTAVGTGTAWVVIAGATARRGPDGAAALPAPRDSGAW